MLTKVDQIRARRSICMCLCVMVFVTWGAGFSVRADDQASGLNRPNIILFFADDLGYGELGCQGNPQIPTPHIDALANGGVRFTSGYVTSPYCSGSRAGLLTGVYQTRFGYEYNPIGAENEAPGVGVPTSQLMLSEHLQQAGYATALIGKWHLGAAPIHHPFRRGFDEFFGFLHEGHYFMPPPYRGVTTMLRRRTLPDGRTGRDAGRWLSLDQPVIYTAHMGHDEPDYDANNPIFRGGQPVTEEAYLTDAFTREAIDFIDRHKSQPFFLYLAYNAVHSPLQGAEAYMKKFAHIEDIQRRIFAAMLSNLDDSVGAVMKKVREAGLKEKTLVFFMSDNGGPTRELTSSNLPLRGSKGQMYEGGIRVPFIMHWPGRVPANTVYEKPVISLDVFGTAAAIANAPLPRGREIDGVNLLPFLTGTKEGRPHTTLYWRLKQRTAVRVGDWKLVHQPTGGRAKWELFNLADDVSESRDLSETMPEKVEQLLGIWEELDAQMAEPAWERGK